MIEIRFCIDCYGRLTFFEGARVYYCWSCHEKFDKEATLTIGDLEVILQDVEKAKRERGTDIKN